MPALDTMPTIAFLKAGQLPGAPDPTVYQGGGYVPPAVRGRHRFDRERGRLIIGRPGREYRSIGMRRHLPHMAGALSVGVSVGALYWTYVNFPW